jgi:hypothetical protein
MAHNAPESKRLREEARTQMQDLHGFDCTAAAELFMIDPKKLKGRVTCKRFDTAADALRFAIEEIPSPAPILRSMIALRISRNQIRVCKRRLSTAFRCDRCVANFAAEEQTQPGANP